MCKRHIKLLNINILCQQCNVAALFSLNHRCSIQGLFSSFSDGGIHVSTYMRFEHKAPHPQKWKADSFKELLKALEVKGKEKGK